MSGVLRLLATVAVLVAIAFSIELLRRRGIRSWALELGGTFESGEAPVPEAADFDAGSAPGQVTYRNVWRIRRGDATFIVARYVQTWHDVRDKVQSQGHVVCFIVDPKLDLPPITVHEFMRDPGPPLPGAVERFQKRWHVDTEGLTLETLAHRAAVRYHSAPRCPIEERPMPDSPAKRAREAKKRQKREIKAERKRLRKAGLLGTDETGQPLVSDPSQPALSPDEATPAPASGPAPQPPAAPPPPKQV